MEDLGKFLYERKQGALKDYPYMDKHRKNLSNTPHYHDEIEIIFVLWGRVTVFCHLGRVTAEAGDIAVLMPKEVHNFITETENRVYVMKLYCKNSVDETDLTEYRFSGCLIKNGTELNKALTYHINEMAKDYGSPDKGAGYAVNAHSNMIISLVLRSELCEKQDTNFGKRNEATVHLLKKVTSYIESHFDERISLEQMAIYCNMSKYYFAHTFKETFGMTFLDYLTQYRMRVASHLLVETNKSITLIGNLSGFSSTRMFNNLFKARFGMSPTEYRKKMRGQ